MKYGISALAAATFSATLFAAVLPSPDYYSNVAYLQAFYNSARVPDLPGGFVLGLTEYYLQPELSNGALDYAVIDYRASPRFPKEVLSTNPAYDWGFNITGGYIFPHTANDLDVTYFHLHTFDDVKDYNLPQFSRFANPRLLINFANLDTQTRIYVDQIDIAAGQYVDIERASLHFDAGIRLADLQEKLAQTATTFTSSEQTTVSVLYVNNENNTYKGLGPVMGIDGSVNVYRGFGLAGHVDGAILLGQGGAHKDFTALESGAESAFSIVAVDAAIRRVIVPVLDGKVGVNYLYNRSPDARFTAELGFQGSEYFNAINRNLFTASSLAPNLNVSLNEKKTSNLSLAGPYLSLTFAGII